MKCVQMVRLGADREFKSTCIIFLKFMETSCFKMAMAGLKIYSKVSISF